jgi:dTDP-4-amino-4,6-dideoxygalactose transaminase
MTDLRIQVPFVDLGAQHRELEPDLGRAVQSVIDRGDFILGGDVAAFEDEFAAYSESAHGVGVDSGLSALDLALRALGVGPGDEVITVANTFVASALAISQAGATPVLVDMDPATYQIDVGQIESAVGGNTAAILPVHLYGQPADMDPILEIAAARGLAVVEDASQAHGARYQGRRVGSLGDAAGFSLYPAKNLGALGDGGIIVTQDRALADALRLLRNYGSPVKYVHDVVGFNRRLDTIHAAALRLKLARLDEWNDRRRHHADSYRDALGDLADVVKLPPVVAGTEAVYHLFVIRVSERDSLAEHLSRRGVSTVVHYPTPIHLLGAYEGLGHRRGSFPETEAHADECLSLPMYPHLETSQVEQVCAAIREFYGR